MTVDVNAVVTPTFDQLGPYCAGSAADALPTTSTNAITGTWSPSVISTATPGSTVYTFTPDGGACVTTATMTVDVNAVVTPTFDQLGPYCAGSAADALPTTSTNAITGTWSPSVISTATPGSTVYTFTPDGGACVTTATMTVVINALPVVNAGTDASILHGTSTTLHGSVTGEGTFSYLWTPSDRVVSPTAVTTLTTSLNTTTIFTLTATSLTSGCSASDDVNITITGSELTVTAQATPQVSCAGSNVQLLEIASGGSGNYSYTWTSNPTSAISNISNPIVTPTVTTIYYANVNDGFNIATNQVIVTVNPLPGAIAGMDRSIYLGQSTTLGASAAIGSTYSWTSDPAGFTSTEANPTVVPAITTTYTVVETITATGCINANSVVVTVNHLPTSFIPVWWPGNGTEHMNFYALTATLDGSDLQPGDAIGIFDGDICVGVGVLTEILTGSNYLSIIVSHDDSDTPEIDGYTIGNEATFRIWDASEDNITVFTEATFSSGSNVFVMSATSVFNLSGDNPINQTISLETGWNIISFTAEPENPSLMAIVDPLITAGTLLKVQDEGGNAIEELVFGWIDEIGAMKATEGYKIKVTENTELNILGKPVGTSVDIPLMSGWNIMGYPFVSGQAALTALDPLISAGNLLKVQDEAGNAIEELFFGWVDEIVDFLPGEGYMIKTNANTTLTINGINKGRFVITDHTTPHSIHFRPIYEGNGLDHMNVYVINPSMDGAVLTPEDEIGLFDGDLCVGVGIVEDMDQPYIAIIGSVDDPTSKQIDGFIEGHPFDLRVWKYQTGVESKSQNLSTEKGYATYFIKNGTSVLTVKFEKLDKTYLADVFPNPADNKATFIFKLTQKNQTRLEIINSLGDVVRVLVDEVLSEGQHKIEWDLNTASGSKALPGIYYYRLVSAGFSMTKSMVIQ